MSALRFVAGAGYTAGAAGVVVSLSTVRGASRAWETVGHAWARGLMRICGLQLQVSGRERLAGPAVFVANHRSFLDPMLLTAVLPVRTKWVAKAEFRRVPLLGRAFGACAIYVDRHDPSAARSTLDDALAALPPGWSVGLFPEGTRSRDGELQTFKKGAVHLALQLGLPIVPIGVAAPTEVVPYGPRTFEPGVVEIDVGPPLPTGGWTADDVGARTAELRTAVAACVERARARLA